MKCVSLNHINKISYFFVKSLFIICIFSVFHFHNLSAQNLTGAKNSALCNSTVAQSNDAFSIFINPSGTAQLGWREAGTYYSPSPYGLKELATVTAVYVEHTVYGNFGLGFSAFGFNLYKENKFALNYSHRLFTGYFLGITVIYQNLKIQNYGSAGAFNIVLGGISYITQNLRTGFALENLLRSTYGNTKDQIPVVINSGLSYDILENATVNLALVKELGYDFSVRFGAEYLPVDFLSLRFGISDYPQIFTAGAGINYSIFSIDYAVESHPDLGLTHQFGFSLQFSGYENRTMAIKNYLFNKK